MSKERSKRLVNPNKPKLSNRKFRPGTVSTRIVPLLSEYRNASIARKVGCSGELVRQVRIKTGIPAPVNIESQQKLDKIRTLARSGRVAREIGEIVGIAPERVRAIATRHGIKLKKAKPGVGIDQQKLSEFKALVSKGKSVSSAGRAVGIFYTTAYRWAKRFKLKRKS